MCGNCWVIGPKSNLGSNTGYLIPAFQYQNSILNSNECSVEEITQWAQCTPGGPNQLFEKQIFQVIIKGRGLYKVILFFLKVAFIIFS